MTPTKPASRPADDSAVADASAHADKVVRSPERLAAVRATGLLDSAAEPAFNRLTELAVRLLRVPAAFMSLVDVDRDFYKAAHGFAEPLASERELAGRTFCHYSISMGTPERPLAIPDTRADEMFKGVPTVESLGVAAYAGVPLIVAGQPIGSFCVIDSQPHDWTEDELAVLRELTTSAQREIELRMALAESTRAIAEIQRTHRERDELLDATTDGVYTTDTEGRIQFVNRAGAEMLRYKPEDMLGRESHGLIHHTAADGTTLQREACPILRVIQDGVPVSLDDEVLWRSDGTWFPVSYASSPVIRDGMVVSAVVRFTDSTDRKRSAQALQLLAESGRLLTSSLNVEDTLRALAEIAVPALADGVMVDLVQRDGTFRRAAASHTKAPASESFARAVDYPPQEGDGSPQWEVLRTGEPLLIANFRETWQGNVHRGPGFEEILDAIAPGAVMVIPMRVRDSILGTVSFVRAVGESAFGEYEADLAQELSRRAVLALENARLYDASQSASRARDDMLGVVSHDLRDPLHTIYMSGALLLELLPENAKLERTQAAIIRRAAERANRLIQDLLDVRRIESGFLKLERDHIKISSLVNESVEQSAMRAAELGVALLPGDLAPGVTAFVDRYRILQALSNLIGNALKFTPKGGRVTVSATCVNNTATIIVEDTGRGIAPEHVPHLFDSYWQADRTDKRGVGLGLPIVKGLMEAHGGRVEVSSEPGAGSTFTLSLPAHVPDEDWEDTH